MATIAADAILTAVRDVLDGAAGSLRTIGATVYDGSAYADLDDEEKSRRGLVRPTFDIVITDLEPHASAPPRNGSLGIYVVRLEVAVFRHLGPQHKVSDSARDDVRALAVTDGDVIAQALEWPGNLTQDAGSNATGLVGGKVMYDGSSLRRADMADNRPGVIETVHRFHGFAQVTMAVS